MKSGFWKKDWFLGLTVSLVLLLAGGGQLIQSLERSAYDWGVRASNRTASDKVVVIAIDDSSIRNIGRWPWSREVHAKMTDMLTLGRAKVIGNLVYFSEPQVDAGLAYINKLLEIFGGYAPGADGEPPAVTGSEELVQLGSLLREAEDRLNTDRRLSVSYGNSKNVLLPILFELGEPRGKPDKPLADYVTRNRVPKVDPGTGDPPVAASGVNLLQIEDIGNKAAAIGHLNSRADPDGGTRTEPLVLQFCRVAGRGCPRPAPSEPCMGLSVHTAQASTKASCDTRRHCYFATSPSQYTSTAAPHDAQQRPG